jgi:TonB family protein
MLQLKVNRRDALLAVAIFFFVLNSALAQDQQGALAPGANYRGDLHALAGRILKRADGAKCHRNHCTILVANFIGPSGSTSRLGVELADSISAELRSQANGVQIVERVRLQDFLVREHIPSNLFNNREAARWLADQFEANAVLIGTIEQLGDRWNLLTELLNISNKGIGPQEATWLTIPDPQSSLAPFEPYDAERQNPVVTSAQGDVLARAGVNGVGVPMCDYCPPPTYTDPARKVKLNGSVILQVKVSEAGRAEDISVVKGLSFGLTERAIKSVSGWKFKPATGEDGKPVSVLVPIEVTFRLY